ncbi:MAG: ABC transporter ATP-binding protein [Burkholderiales bacterium]|nr:ABC transporter ATP-binding protein [Burkholderiales bacterium]
MVTITQPSSEPAIAVCGVHKRYGALHAVNGVDLTIQRGEVFGLIGHNGAGKSTLFKMMLGLIPVSQGEIRIHGARVDGPGFREVRRRMGYLPENVVLYDNLSGLETLQFFARLKGVPVNTCAATLERVGLTHASHRAVREYSKGMRQRLGFAQALLGQPQVLFLDEPTTGLDPEAIRAFYATLRDLQEQGVTLILTSHILAELQERVDRLAIMASGKIQAVGSVQALRDQVNMPLSITVNCAPTDASTVQNVLAQVSGLSGLKGLPTHLLGSAAGHITVQCPREAKMRVLATLAGLGALVQDIHVMEPSLEDVFFGFAD